MQRALIVGSPGTGKTTFARQLAAKTGLPLVHLDFYYHDKTKDYTHDKPAWHAKVRQLIAADEWIMDGNYNATIGERMARADAIFYFDMPRTVAMWGAVKRRVQKPERPDMPADWQETADPEFLKRIWSFQKDHAAAIEYLLQKHAGKQIMRFETRGQIDDYLGRL